MTFQIPWKHAAKHGWDINKDACLFRSWAIHTGVQGGGGAEERPWGLRAAPSAPTQHVGLLEQGDQAHLCFSRTESIVLASSQRIYKNENLRKHASGSL